MASLPEDLEMRCRRRFLAGCSEVQRQEVIARFVLSHAQVADDLQKIVDLRRWEARAKERQTLDEIGRMMADKIEMNFQQAFGQEMLPRPIAENHEDTKGRE